MPVFNHINFDMDSSNIISRSADSQLTRPFDNWLSDEIRVPTSSKRYLSLLLLYFVLFVQVIIMFLFLVINFYNFCNADSRGGSTNGSGGAARGVRH